MREHAGQIVRLPANNVVGIVPRQWRPVIINNRDVRRVCLRVYRRVNRIDQNNIEDFITFNKMILDNTDGHNELGLSCRDSYRGGQYAKKVAGAERRSRNDLISDLHRLCVGVIEHQYEIDHLGIRICAFKHLGTIDSQNYRRRITGRRCLWRCTQIDGQASTGAVAGTVGEGVGESIGRTMRAGIEGVDVAAIRIDDERAEFTRDSDNTIGAYGGWIACGAANASDSCAI